MAIVSFGPDVGRPDSEKALDPRIRSSWLLSDVLIAAKSWSMVVATQARSAGLAVPDSSGLLVGVGGALAVTGADVQLATRTSSTAQACLIREQCEGARMRPSSARSTVD